MKDQKPCLLADVFAAWKMNAHIGRPLMNSTIRQAVLMYRPPQPFHIGDAAVQPYFYLWTSWWRYCRILLTHCRYPNDRHGADNRQHSKAGHPDAALLRKV